MRIVIADQDPRVRALIKYSLTLQQDAVIVGEASEGIEAAALLEYGEPDVLIMDSELPGLDETVLDPGRTRVITLNRDGAGPGSLDKEEVLAEMRRFMLSVLNLEGTAGDGGGRGLHEEGHRQHVDAAPSSAGAATDE